MSNLTFDEVQLKRDCFDENVVNGIRHSFLNTLALDKPPVCGTFCEPETLVYEK